MTEELQGLPSSPRIRLVGLLVAPSEVPSLPWFVVPFGDTDREHTYRGSLLRHVTVERVLYQLNHVEFDLIGEACPLFHVLLGFTDILFGLNCNFPLRNIALFAAWSMHLVDPFNRGPRSRTNAFE